MFIQKLIDERRVLLKRATLLTVMVAGLLLCWTFSLPLGDHGTVTDHIAVPNADDCTSRDHFDLDDFRAIVRVVVERDASRGADDFAHRGDHGGDAQADGRLAAPPIARIDFSSKSHVKSPVGLAVTVAATLHNHMTQKILDGHSWGCINLRCLTGY